VLQSTNRQSLRTLHLTLKHTVNFLLYKQHTEGTVLLFRTQDVDEMKDVHNSPQHQADSKGKQEGWVLGDLSGQRDPSYNPLNGTASSKPKLRALISSTWGKIRRPTVNQLVLMVLTAADIHGWSNLIFVWIGMLHAFQVLTRSLQAISTYIITGLCHWYVDDLTAVTSLSVIRKTRISWTRMYSRLSTRVLSQQINPSMLGN